MNLLSYGWSLLVGVIAVVWQILSYYFRFGQFNPYAPWSDYIWFFLSGSLGGLILVMFLNRQTASKSWWSVLIAFVLATPVAMIFMLGGGLLNFGGTLILPQIPWFIFTWIGSLVGKFLSR